MTPHADKSEAYREGHRAQWQYGSKATNPYGDPWAPGAPPQADEWNDGDFCAWIEREQGKPNPYQPITTT